MKKVLSIFVAVMLACGMCGSQAYATSLFGGNTYNDNSTTNKGGDANQAQGQLQGQAQIQGQAQGQTQKAVGVGVGVGISGAAAGASSGTFAPNTQSTSIVFEAKRDLVPIAAALDGPNMTEFRGPYKDGVAGKVKPWVIKKEWTDEEANGMYSAMDDASCTLYPIKKLDRATANLMVLKGTKPAVAILDCKGTSDFSIWGTAATKAMSYGAGFIEEAAYAITFSNKSSGWNIGFGGGVTAVNGGADTMGGSVGGGTGFGSVTTAPVENISVVFFLR